MKTFIKDTPSKQKKKTITKKDIISFAEKWDYQPFHIDEKLARQSHYGGLIASGWQTIAIAHSLILDTQKPRNPQWGLQV